MKVKPSAPRSMSRSVMFRSGRQNASSSSSLNCHVDGSSNDEVRCRGVGSGGSNSRKANVGPVTWMISVNLRLIAPVPSAVMSMWKCSGKHMLDVTIFLVCLGIRALVYLHLIDLSRSQSKRWMTSVLSQSLRSISSKTIPSCMDGSKSLSASLVETMRGDVNWCTAHCVFPVPVGPHR